MCHMPCYYPLPRAAVGHAQLSDSFKLGGAPFIGQDHYTATIEAQKEKYCVGI